MLKCQKIYYDYENHVLGLKNIIKYQNRHVHKILLVQTKIINAQTTDTYK